MLNDTEHRAASTTAELIVIQRLCSSAYGALQICLWLWYDYDYKQL